MRPVLCSLSLWLWVRAGAALTITSISDNNGVVQVGKLMAVVWQDAVGSVNASLVSSGQNEAVQTILPLGTGVVSPFVWTPTKDFAGGQYYFQLQDQSGDAPAKSSSFSVQAVSVTSSQSSSSSTGQPTANAPSSSPSASPTTYLPAAHVASAGSHFSKGAQIGVGIGAAIVGIAAIGIGGYCFHRKRKRAMLRRRATNSGDAGGAGGEEKMLPIAPPFQSATEHPLAMTSEDQEDQDPYQGIVKQDGESPRHELPLSAKSPEEPKPYQSSAALRLEHPVILETHELEQPTPELEGLRAPSELDSQMIYPVGELESPAETPGARRTRAARDKLGSDHWTFLRESSATLE